MKLYHRPDCPFCWKVRLVLRESDITVQEVAVGLGQKHPDVVALNPNATVPVLVEGDMVLWDSGPVAEYLAERFPQSGLMAGSPAQRAKIRQIHSYSDNIIGKILFPHIKQVRENQGQTAAGEVEQKTSTAWRSAQEILSEQLGDEDFFGPEFSLADCALLPRVTLAQIYGLPLSQDFHNLGQWYQRCLARSSFAAVFPAVFPGINEMIKLDSLRVSPFNKLVKSTELR